MNQYPKVIISSEGEKWLDKGQRWMYQNNLVSYDDTCVDGGIASIYSESGRYLGTGFFNAKSHITVRILSHDENAIIDEGFFAKRIQSAWNFRKVVENENLDNCRIIFGDADLLPGLTVDRYNDVLVSQISNLGMEMRKDMIYALLLNILREDGQEITGIYERNDVKIRQKEGLELYQGPWNQAQLSTLQVIDENGLKLNVDIENGQKTGYFLDQKSNRMLVRKLSKDLRVLDCFTHTGGFALNAGFGHAKSVVGVDVSRVALDEAEANAKLNGLDNVTFTQADVFDYLDECEIGQYDLIVLDPPAFTKSRKTILNAYNGYKRINVRAMELLQNEGYLVTCSCSRYMETQMFEQMLKEAAQEAGVILKQISVTQQNGDHPILWQMDETSYLKFFIFQIIRKTQ